jgi:hypothetical protein
METTMRKNLALAVLCCLCVGVGRAPAAERDDAVAILDQAIKAQGGADALAKAAQRSQKGGGAVTLSDKDYEFTDELILQLPDRIRHTIVVTTPDKQKARVVQVVNKDRGWYDNGGVVEELSEQRLGELKEEAHVQWLRLLVPLVKKDSAYQLAVLKETKVNDKPAVGVKASLKGHPDIHLYFDKESALLVKIERQAQEQGVEVAKEYFFSDYKEVEGVKLPVRTVEKLNGKKFLDLKVESYKLLNKVEDAQFAKP